MEEIKHELYKHLGWVNAECEFSLKEKDYNKSLILFKNLEIIIKLIREVENNDK